MDFAIHDSSLGKGYLSCDKTYSALLGTNPVEGLVLHQSTWAKSESSLRLLSGVLGTAEHFMAAAGSLLKDKGDAFDGGPKTWCFTTSSDEYLIQLYPV